MSEEELCPCSSGSTYAECCEPFHLGKEAPATAEALMRARFSAHPKIKGNFIFNTMSKERRKNFNLSVFVRKLKKTKWTDFKIINTEQGGQNDTSGVVEFEYSYLNWEEVPIVKEVAKFKKISGNWTLVSSKTDEGKQKYEENHFTTIVHNNR